jgi:hypothetical protein
MAHGSHYSNSAPQSPRSPSPAFSLSSDKPTNGYGAWDSGTYPQMSGSRGGSPANSDDDEDLGGVEVLEPVDSVICQWENCGRPFSHLPTLINHIHNGTDRTHGSGYLY